LNPVGLADHVVQAFRLRGLAVPKTIADDAMLGVVATSDEESIALDVVPGTGRLSRRAREKSLFGYAAVPS
jgi:hypothetical protein